MTEWVSSIIVALIVAAGTMISTSITARKGYSLACYKIEQLEKKVDKHNNFAQRMPIVEEQIKVINHRLEDIEREG